MVPGKKTLLAFREVAVIPKVGRLYALSIAPIANRFQISLPKCKRVPQARATSTLRPGRGEKLSHTLWYML